MTSFGKQRTLRGRGWDGVVMRIDTTALKGGEVGDGGERGRRAGLGMAKP
jgi:hypothetical protein